MTTQNQTGRPGTGRLLAACVLMPVLFTFALAASALATADFRVTGDIYTSVSGQNSISRGVYDRSGFIQAGDGVTYDNTDSAPDFTYHIQSDSLADVGGLRTHAYGQIFKNVSGTSGGYDFGVGAGGAAFATYYDMVITGPAGPISTSVNMNLHGGLIADSYAPVQGSDSASAGVQVGFIVNNSNIGGGSQTLYSSNGGSPTLFATGVLANWGAGPLTSPSFVVQANLPFTLQIQLIANAQVTGYIGGSYILGANADFGSTLAFPTSGPVFNLPVGYSINSADAGIVDNQYVAPEPCSLALAGTCLFLLARAPRRTGRRRASQS